MKSTKIFNLDWKESKSDLDEFILTATAPNNVRYTLRLVPASTIDYSTKGEKRLPLEHPDVRFFINIEYGAHNYNHTLLEDNKYKQFSRAAGQEFCARDYDSYLHADTIKWCDPAAFRPSFGVNHKLVGINAKHKAHYEIYSVGSTNVEPDDWSAGRTCFATKTNLTSGKKKILNSRKLRLWGKKFKPLSAEDCLKLCERDYAKSRNSALEQA